MASGRYISYLRVSGDKQEGSGLGLEAQRIAVENYLDGGRWRLMKEFVEVESGTRNDRPMLDEALRACRLQNATLIVGKLDRLARNTRFLLKLVEESGNRGVVFCDLPYIPEGPAGKLMTTQMAGFAEYEGAIISQRTKDALKAAKARGVKLGGRRVSSERFREIAAQGRAASVKARSASAARHAADVLPVIEDIRSTGASSYRQIAAELNHRGILTARGGVWTAVQVMRVLRNTAAA